MEYLKFLKCEEIVKWLDSSKKNKKKQFWKHIRIKVPFASFYFINKDQTVDGVYFNSSDTVYMVSLVLWGRLNSKTSRPSQYKNKAEIKSFFFNFFLTKFTIFLRSVYTGQIDLEYNIHI